MFGTLTRLSDTRWRYETGRRTYDIRQLRASGEGFWVLGLYGVDGGESHTGTLAADSVERLVEALDDGQTPELPTETKPAPE